ncbi:MAG: hypothetical protein ACRYGA_02545 [Janthinobacterium lividum]
MAATCAIVVRRPMPSLAGSFVLLLLYSARGPHLHHVRSDDALLGSLLAPLVGLNLPIVFDAAAAQARLEDLCTPRCRRPAHWPSPASAASPTPRHAGLCDRAHRARVPGLLKTTNHLRIAAMPLATSNRRTAEPRDA